MSDILIRDVPEHTVAEIDRRASENGVSRNEYLRHWLDREIRPHNRTALESHPLFPLITLIEDDSVSHQTLINVRAEVKPGNSVLILLDSNHSKAHVLAELDAYAPLVNPGSYMVVMDGIMSNLVGAPRAAADWHENNPRVAAREWVARHPDFVIEEPPFSFNEGQVRSRVTYWPDAFLRRVR